MTVSCDLRDRGLLRDVWRSIQIARALRKAGLSRWEAVCWGFGLLWLRLTGAKSIRYER